MTDGPDTWDNFDRALLRAAFDEIEWQGWHSFTTASAARTAGLALGDARVRFPNRHSVAARLGELADKAALASLSATPVADLAGAPTRQTSPRERLFDALLQRVDVFQAYRGGVLAMLRAAPLDPALAATLVLATPVSIGWIADAAGIGGTGLAGLWHRQVLTAAWTYAFHAWTRDESPDLSGTMAALDRALGRVARIVPLDGDTRSGDDGEEGLATVS